VGMRRLLMREEERLTLFLMSLSATRCSYGVQPPE
jgi:hypothetical protein